MTRRIVTRLASSSGLFVSGLVCTCLLGVAFLGSPAPVRQVTAQFADADGLVPGNEVRVAGVAAGSVDSVTPVVDAGGRQYAQVVLSVDADQWPLRQGTKLAVTPKGVLSNVFVALTPGSPHNASLGDHPFFGLNQTQSPVNLVALNDVFTGNVREAIRTQLQEGVLAFGNGGSLYLNQTLSNAAPLTADTIPVTDVLATRSPQLDALNFEFDTVTAELASEDSSLRPLITNLDTTMGAVAAQQVNLQGTLTQAASVFSELSSALSSPVTRADLARIFATGPEALDCAASVANLTPLVTAVNPYIRYTSPYSLDSVLGDLVTASGFNTNTVKGTPPPSGDALRVDAIDVLPTAHFHFFDSGGLTLAHAGYINASKYGKPAYESQPPITSYPTLSGCTAPAGLP